MSETFIKIDSLQRLEISRQTYPTNQGVRSCTGQKSVLQHSLLWRYANFSKLMRTIHISMTSTFQCEYCQCFTFKRCNKFKLKCTSHGDMYSAHYFGKISGFLELYSRFQSLEFQVSQAKLSFGEPSNKAVSRRPWPLRTFRGIRGWGARRDHCTYYECRYAKRMAVS